MIYLNFNSYKICYIEIEKKKHWIKLIKSSNLNGINEWDIRSIKTMKAASTHINYIQ